MKNSKFLLYSKSVSSRIISYYDINEKKMTLCNWNSECINILLLLLLFIAIKYESVYIIGFLYDICKKEYIDYIEYLNKLIWILNSEYDGIKYIYYYYYYFIVFFFSFFPLFFFYYF